MAEGGGTRERTRTKGGGYRAKLKSLGFTTRWSVCADGARTGWRPEGKGHILRFTVECEGRPRSGLECREAGHSLGREHKKGAHEGGARNSLVSARAPGESSNYGTPPPEVTQS